MTDKNWSSFIKCLANIFWYLSSFSKGRRYRWVSWLCPQIVVAKKFSGAKYHINTEYEQKVFLLILMVSRAKISPDLGFGPKHFFRIAKWYISLEPEIYEEFHYECYFTWKKYIIFWCCHKYKDSSFKKNAHVTKNLYLMMKYFVPRNAVAHRYKQTVIKSLTKQSSDRKKLIYLDFNLADTKCMHKKWCYVWMLMLILMQGDRVESAANLVVSILSISLQIKRNHNDMNTEHM